MFLNQNVIKVDLNASDAKLKSLFEATNLDYTSVIENKEEFDVLFITASTNMINIFAFIRKGKSKIEFTETYYKFLNDLNFVKTIIVEGFDEDKDIENVERVMPDIDTILEKITATGLDSLTKEEKNILDISSGVKTSEEKPLNEHQSASPSFVEPVLKQSSKKNTPKPPQSENENYEAQLSALLNQAKTMLKDSPGNKRRWVNKYKKHELYGIVASVIYGKYDQQEMEKRIVKFLKKRNN